MAGLPQPGAPNRAECVVDRVGLPVREPYVLQRADPCPTFSASSSTRNTRSEVAMLNSENDTFAPLEVGKVASAQQSHANNPIAAAAIDRLFDKHRGEYFAEAQRLIQACSSLIAETGQVDPPVNAILERAGLGTRAFYRLFNSKEELIIAVLQDGTTWKTSYIAEQMATASTPLERIRAWVEAAISPTPKMRRRDNEQSCSTPTGGRRCFPTNWQQCVSNSCNPLFKQSPISAK
ncbi:TetR/AcrR family transcriptional regulator [Rhodococcus opacus]|nr:TetR/AcrR family transcriptional regulator [Rhodococcus opacus]